MYVSKHDLGRFEIPEGANWPLRVSYIQEQPQAVRGSMNPWEQERKRALWLAENEAWKQIQNLQVQYRSKAGEFDRAAARSNQLIGEIENLMGISGLQKVMGSQGFNMAAMAITMTNPYGAAIALALQAIKFGEIGFKILSGEAKRKKKRLAQLEGALADQQKIMQQVYADMQQQAADIVYLTHTRDRGMLQQSENVKVEMMNNQIMHAQRKAGEQTRAASHAARALAARRTNPYAYQSDSL